MTQARYVAGVDLAALVDPDGEHWRAARPETLALMGTPLGLQPTDAIRVAWARKKIGIVSAVDLAVVHNGSEVALRLEWSDSGENREIGDTGEFPDAAAVAFPLVADAPLTTMGAPGQGVNAWYWRADDSDRGRDVVAEGLGTSRTVESELVHTRGVWKGGRWQVVIARALRVETAEPLIQLERGGSTQFGVAIWEGANGERAGIKAFSGEWRELVLE